MVTDCDVIVVGLGGMGSAAAYQLARRGLRVVGIEQFGPAHTLGSSHGGSRIVRKAYFEGPAYVPLLQRSYQLWDELSAEFGEQLFTRCGALMIGAPDSPVVTGARASAERWQLPHELLDGEALRRRYPQFRLPADQVAVFESDAGYALPEATVLANLELAADAGAELWFDTTVEAVELGPSGVHVTAADEELVAPKAVLATGAWADRLAHLDRYPLSVTRQSTHWFTPARPDDFDPARFPVYLWDAPVPPGAPDVQLYGFPRLPGEAEVKAARYRDAGTGPVDPDALDRVVTARDHEPVGELLSRALPGLAGPPVRSSVCMYPAAAGDDFVLGLHPGSSGRVVLAVGFSGHGFKFTPVVGEIVADLVTEGRSRLDLGFLSPARFG
ncbi:MAG TPA: N-methyl-L-tryptophan oxidase [Jatrophihabitans sp.]|nr:N-methyl-L-tryptophan oxidase [Jatrophihabitans sp.]